MTDEMLELLVTPQQFKRLFPALGALSVAGFLPTLNKALAEFAIDTPQRISAFIAQVGHESRGLTRWTENLNYSAARLMVVFPSRFRTLEKAQAVVDGGPEMIAEAIYGMRRDLGNLQPGDGYRYRGRGPIQLTGRANYRSVGEQLNTPLELEPDLAATPPAGFRIAGYFWASRGCNELADRSQFGAITDAINGPAREGHEQRIVRWHEASVVLGADPHSQTRNA